MAIAAAVATRANLGIRAAVSASWGGIAPLATTGRCALDERDHKIEGGGDADHANG